MNKIFKYLGIGSILATATIAPAASNLFVVDNDNEIVTYNAPNPDNPSGNIQLTNKTIGPIDYLYVFVGFSA
jgi:hypothetical protein